LRSGFSFRERNLIQVDGQLIEAKHPALIDEVIWISCLTPRIASSWAGHSTGLMILALSPTPRSVDEQLARSRRLFEFGEYEWDTFMAKRAQIQEEQQRLRNEAAASPTVDDAEWCRAQILDLLGVGGC
jgi:hypothetical protein